LKQHKNIQEKFLHNNRMIETFTTSVNKKDSMKNN
jgi:hypothetical protein